MGSVIGTTWWQKLFALVIIILIPVGISYADYINDPIEQYQGQFFSYSVNLNITINEVILSYPTEIPAFSRVNFFVNFSNPSIQTDIIVTKLEPSEFAGYLDGTYPENQLDRLIESDGVFSGWLNFTTLEEGLIRFALTHVEATIPVNINGIYSFETESWISRNLAEMIIVFGIYTIIVFGVIPETIKRVKINSMKRRKQQELIAEDEEFYKNLNIDK